MFKFHTKYFFMDLLHLKVSSKIFDVKNIHCQQLLDKFWVYLAAKIGTFKYGKTYVEMVNNCQRLKELSEMDGIGK